MFFSSHSAIDCNGKRQGHRKPTGLAKTCEPKAKLEICCPVRQVREERRLNPCFTLHQALALGAFAGQLAGAANAFRLFTGSLFGWLFVVITKLHFPKDAFALHLLFEGLEGLIDIIVANENLHASIPKVCFVFMLKKRTR
jgi:hypothetical protein